jgi:acyl-coenzyme A synthetase/AMP-(fatty) acid ligase
MGYRIELQDIEQVLVSIAGVRDAGVILTESKSDGLAELVAYIEKDETVSSSDIYMAMKKKLPVYMLPKQVLVIGRLPRSDRGKIDRASLISYHRGRGS